MQSYRIAMSCQSEIARLAVSAILLSGASSVKLNSLRWVHSFMVTDLQLTADDHLPKNLLRQHGQLAVIPGGLHLRRPRVIIFAGDLTGADSTTLHELRKRGFALVCTGTATPPPGIHLNCQEADKDSFFQLLQRKKLDVADAVLVKCAPRAFVPSWISAHLVLALGYQSDSELVLPAISLLLELLSISPQSARFAGGSVSGVSDVRDLPEMLREHASDSIFAAYFTADACAWGAATRSLELRHDLTPYVLTVVASDNIQSVANATLASISELFSYTLLSARTLASATSSASGSLPLIESLEFHIQFHGRMDSEELSQVRKTLREISDLRHCDLVLQADDLNRTIKRLAVFDMDSTLVQQECIDEMAALAGAGEKVKEITQRAMNGELDFAAALQARVALLQGMNGPGVYSHVIRNLQYTTGALFMATVLRRLGLTLAVVSGGFIEIVANVKSYLQLDFGAANELELSGELLTGKLVSGSPIIDAKAKLHHLERLADEIGAHPLQAMAVGDGANVRHREFCSTNLTLPAGSPHDWCCWPGCRFYG